DCRAPPFHQYRFLYVHPSLAPLTLAVGRLWATAKCLSSGLVCATYIASPSSVVISQGVDIVHLVCCGRMAMLTASAAPPGACSLAVFDSGGIHRYQTP